MKKSGHRTGFGFDSHSYAVDGQLVLGGVSIPGEPALKGHSDGDALLHAVIDALLGAAGMGDIGELYPDTSAGTKGMSSLVMLREVAARLRQANLAATHVDVTVVAERPRLSAHKAAIKDVLRRELSLDDTSANVKAKTPEGLTLFAKPTGVAVWAVATVEPI